MKFIVGYIKTMETRFIFVTGGVLSSLGKGIISASVGALMETAGQRVSCIKLDPYLNVDSGTMNPAQHGEVFVTHDGGETDLDLGHYERFLTDVNLSKHNSITTGKVYTKVLKMEREGKYLGQTVQVIPHVTDMIIEMIDERTADVDIMLVEIGGTVGDIESLPFLEAIRQMRLRYGPDRCMFIHLGYVPYLTASGEHKTKPIQHSTKTLSSYGIQPDMLICRSDTPIKPLEPVRTKLSIHTNLPADRILFVPNLSSIYLVPMMLQKQRLDQQILKHFRMDHVSVDMSGWGSMIGKTSGQSVTILMVGKYNSNHDTYKSIVEALTHSGYHHHRRIQIEMISSENSTYESMHETVSRKRRDGQPVGILIPGGFGTRGLDGKLEAIRYGIEHQVPLLGICLGMQLICIQVARMAGVDGSSTEFDPKTEDPIVHLVPRKDDTGEMGGSMRLGCHPIRLRDKSKIQTIHQSSEISERHRHRYEINDTYIPLLEKNHLRVTGISVTDGVKNVEVVELISHPWLVGVQYHPEFQSRLRKPHPLFNAFVKNCINHDADDDDTTHRVDPTVPYVKLA